MTKPHYFIIINGDLFELGELNLYSSEFMFQVSYDCTTNHIKGKNIISGWVWK